MWGGIRDACNITIQVFLDLMAHFYDRKPL